MDTIWGEVGTERRRFACYAGLFVFLVFVYAAGLSRYIRFILSEGKPGGAVINTPLDLMSPIFWFCILSALPIGVLAGYDIDWSSSDAAPICIGAWALVAAGFMVIQHIHCQLVFLFPFVPFIASATTAHAAGHGARWVFDRVSRH